MMEILGKLRRHVHGMWARSRSPEQVFTEIYRKNQWGGKSGEICSGGGSSDSLVVADYIDVLKRHSNEYGFHEMVFVDLGCGDMNVGKELIPLCKSYTGADVVRYVIERNRSAFKDLSAAFVHCDIVNDQLPDGDVCFLRQVLQHLSNDQIRGILPKLCKYRFVYITEHVPTDWNGVSPNPDKPHGRGIRLDQGSGLDLTKQPFGLPEAEIDLVLEVAGNSNTSGLDPGVIRTLLYRPGRVSPN